LSRNNNTKLDGFWQCTQRCSKVRQVQGRRQKNFQREPTKKNRKIAKTTKK